MTTTTDGYINRVLDYLPRATPQREQIATELRGHIAERTAAGTSEAEVLRQLGDPASLAESYLSAVPLVPVSFGRRVLAKLIDFVAPLGVATAWLLSPDVGAIIVFAVIGGSWLFAIYVVIAEARLGQTIGKRLLSMRVVRESGARISIGQSIVRQLPMFFEIFVVDVLFALFTDKHQRAFELASKTRVVKV